MNHSEIKDILDDLGEGPEKPVIRPGAETAEDFLEGAYHDLRLMYNYLDREHSNTDLKAFTDSGLLPKSDRLVDGHNPIDIIYHIELMIDESLGRIRDLQDYTHKLREEFSDE